MRNRVFYTVHNIVSSAVKPARAISRGCHLAGTRIDTRDEIFPTGHPVMVTRPKGTLLIDEARYAIW